MVKKITIITLVASLLFSTPGFSVTDKKDDSLLGVGYILDKMDFITYFTRPLKQKLHDNKIDLNFMGGILQGIDNNVFLDSSRKKDGFLQNTVTGDIFYNYTDDIRLGFGMDFTDIVYYKFSDNNLIDLNFKPKFQVDFLDDRLSFETEYMFDWVCFPSDENSTYINNRMSFFLRNNVTKDFYHKGGFKLEYKNYTSGKVYNSDATRSDRERSDIRYTGEYQFGMKIYKYARIKQTVEFYRNDSNDQFMDYYDYWAVKERTSLTAYFTRKLYSISSFSLTHKMFDDRLNSNDRALEKDNLYVFNVSVLYDITPSFTLSAAYSYRENTSNEPLEKYSGSIITMGLYYSF